MRQFSLSTLHITLLVIVSISTAICYIAYNDSGATSRLSLFSDVSTIAMVLIQILAVYGIIWQLKQQEHISVANFMLEVTKALTHHTSLFTKLKLDEDIESQEDTKLSRDLSNVKETKISNAEIMELLNVYETISTLIDKGAIEFKDINGPFAYRFFKVCDNKVIQDKELIKDAPYYEAIYRLHKQWLKYRNEMGMETKQLNPLSENERINYQKLSAPAVSKMAKV